MTIHGPAEGPFPRGVALDALRPRPEETTVLGRLRALMGPVKAEKIPGRDLQKIGARAAAKFRALWAQEPPRVQEDHPELGGSVAVFCYPGPAACGLLDEAIRAVLHYEYGYQAPAPPPPKPIVPNVCATCGAGVTVGNLGFSDGRTTYCTLHAQPKAPEPPAGPPLPAWQPDWLKTMRVKPAERPPTSSGAAALDL